MSRSQPDGHENLQFLMPNFAEQKLDQQVWPIKMYWALEYYT